MLLFTDFFTLKYKKPVEYDENLVLRLLSGDDNIRNDALDEAADMTEMYKNTGLASVEQAIKTKADRPDCVFFDPEHTCLESSKLEQAGPGLINLAKKKKLLDNIEITGNFISHHICASHIPLFEHMGQGKLEDEIKAADKDQYIAYQLLHAQLHMAAKLKHMKKRMIL